MTTLGRQMALLTRMLLSAGVGYSFERWSNVEAAQIYSATGVVAGVCATLLGFLIASVAIITALVEKTLIANMKKTGHYKVLMDEAFLTCALLLVTLAISTAALVVAQDSVKYVSTVTAFFLTLSLLYAYGSGKKFAVVVSTI